MKLDMQFLNHHSTQYLDLHAGLIKIDYSPQSEAALTNFKVLLLLEISFLLCCCSAATTIGRLPPHLLLQKVRQGQLMKLMIQPQAPVACQGTWWYSSGGDT
jgi:hypothetical protein